MDATALLPPFLARSFAMFIFALGIFLATAHTALAAFASCGTDAAKLGRRARMRTPLLIGALLAIWLAVAIVTADWARFRLVPEPSQVAVDLLVGLVPMIVAVALLFTSKSLRSLNAAMPQPWLIWLQRLERVAVAAQETIRKDAALHVIAKLVLDVVRQGPFVSLACVGGTCTSRPPCFARRSSF